MNHFFELIQQSRKNFLKVIDNFSIEELNKVPSGYNNNLIWNLGHVVVTQQILCYQLSGLDTKLDMNIFSKYRKGTKPETFISAEEFNLIKALAVSTTNELMEDYDKGVFSTFNKYETSYGIALNNIEDAVHFSGVHEGLHLGYIMALRKLI